VAEAGENGGSVNRRQFILGLLRGSAGAVLVASGLAGYSRQASSLPAQAIRPPGALPEDEFVGACIRCGLCVRDCPYDILKLAELGDPVAAGTPYFTARSGPCEMCEDIPCVPVCPTNALDHELTDINQARMGLAVLVDQETCIAFHGLRCEVCFNICPIRGAAISLEMQHNTRSGKHALFIPVVHSTACTGCGLCEKACILEAAAIKVYPLHLAKGAAGDHYRLGWEEKNKAGKSLVTPDVEHRYNLPEGVRYELQGDGLILEPQGGSDQAVLNPLDALNNSSLGNDP
jgi:ferredoxin-type protein NapG